MLPHWTQNDLTVNGVKLHYYRTGGAGKPALVLLHGFSDNGLCWLRLAQDLEAEYDVILPDARGHGLSARLQPGEQVDAAADTAGLIEALGLEQPVVGGHSMGGNTASQLAARYPHLVRALILEDPAWIDPKPGEEAPPRPNPWMEWLLSLENTPLEDIVAKCRADNPTWDEIELPAWAESKKQLDKNVFQVISARPPWRETASAIRCPALLLTADVEKGGIVRPETAREAAELNPNIRLAHIPGVGHNLRRENYPAFRFLVQEFLRSIPK